MSKTLQALAKTALAKTALRRLLKLKMVLASLGAWPPRNMSGPCK